MAPELTIIDGGALEQHELTLVAEDIKQSIDWTKFPKLADTFQHRPCVNVYWHELARLVLQMSQKEQIR